MSVDPKAFEIYTDILVAKKILGVVDTWAGTVARAKTKLKVSS